MPWMQTTIGFVSEGSPWSLYCVPVRDSLTRSPARAHPYPYAQRESARATEQEQRTESERERAESERVRVERDGEMARW